MAKTGTLVAEAVKKATENLPDSKFAQCVRPAEVTTNDELRFDGKSIEVVHKPDPNAKIIVLHITTSYGKRYTCRTVEELAMFIDNYKAEKKFKRDEDMNIELGYGRMLESEYAQIPACKYFIKPQ